jgi:hypothetical protein
MEKKDIAQNPGSELECIKKIRKKYSMGIFTEEDFLKKVKSGTYFYHVGSVEGHGPTEPNKKTFSKDLSIPDLVTSYKGVFIKQEDAIEYREKRKEGKIVWPSK